MQEQTNKTKLDRALFTEELCSLVHDLLGEDYRTEQSEVRKNNGVVKDVLYIRKENSECIPCFYLDELYRSYCGGENMPGLAEHLADVVLNECESVREQAQFFLEKEWIKEHLFVRLVHADTNKEWLREAVYVEVLDLAAVFYVLTEDTEDGVKSFQMPRSVWDTLGLGSAREYFPNVVENTRRLFPEKLWCMEYTLRECRMDGDNPPAVVLVPPEEYESDRLYVLSNYRKINGASVILYPELLRQLGEKFGGNYYVIPSSVHEVLILKENEENDAEHLNTMIRTVNEQHVLPEEVLADHVYCYFAEDGELQSRMDA